MKALIQTTLVLATTCLAACASGRGVEKAMSDSHSEVKGNSHAFHAAPDVTLSVVTGTFVQKGFTIDHSDAGMRLVKASRDLADPKDPNTDYHITATAFVTVDPAGSRVNLAATQQTVLHRKGHSWTMVPLLILPLPIPTGKKYETVTTSEGSILSGTFYAEFFNAVEQGLARTAEFATPIMITGPGPATPLQGQSVQAAAAEAHAAEAHAAETPAARASASHESAVDAAPPPTSQTPPR